MKGEYGSSESLAVLGVQHLLGTKRTKRDYERARRFFEKALNINKKDADSNFYLGLIHLLGLGVKIDIPKALNLFEIPTNDTRAMNSIGYIYFRAPDALEIDPVKTNPYGSIRRDLRKAKSYFEKAAIKGNVNALYNMGCFYLSSTSTKLQLKNVTFSFSDAYDYFKQAAEKGHTFSAYNVAIMHFLGIGTFESC